MPLTSAIDILLLGAGGREHALAEALVASNYIRNLYCTPINGGIAKIATAADIDPLDPYAVRDFAVSHNIGLVVIGPEAPLVAGVADVVRAAGIAVFGPDKQAAQMEGSKAFAKGIMERAGVATAAYKTFDNKDAAKAYIDEIGAPCVIKADGLAAGKGVFVCNTLEEAQAGVSAAFEDFGDAGATVVIEEMLQGPECSVLALTDGKILLPLAASQDHKRAFDGDKGPNTGGMGVYSPVPVVDDKTMQEMVKSMQKVVDQLRCEGIHYSGCLYGGFMLTEAGPKVLEFNARFGDPETQVVLPRLIGDVVELFYACDEGTLDTCNVSWKEDVAVSVVLASGGYPGAYEKGKKITGIAEAEERFGVRVYHAGTKLDDAGDVLTDGGRVLNVVALAKTFEEAREKAYCACKLIDFEGKMYRKDIALRAIAK